MAAYGSQRGLDSVVHIVFVVLLYIKISGGKPICKAGFYYDDATERCDHCSDICQQAEVMNTVDLCHRKCPDWKDVNQDLTTQTSSNNTASFDHESPSWYSDPKNAEVLLKSVIGVVATLLVITGCVVLYVVLRKRCTPQKPCKKRPQQVVQDDPHEMESLTGGGNPVTHPLEDG